MLPPSRSIPSDSEHRPAEWWPGWSRRSRSDPPAVRVEQVEGGLAPEVPHPPEPLDDLARVRPVFGLELGGIITRVDGQPVPGSGLVVTDPDVVQRQMRVDATDAGDHGIGGHGPTSLLRPASRGYPSPMISERTYGAQSMTAPLRDVLVKAPGPAFGRAFDDPAHGFLHACNLEIARAEHAKFVDVLAS